MFSAAALAVLRLHLAARGGIEVFWFFSSQKNAFLS